MHDLAALLLRYGAPLVFLVTLAARIGAPLPAGPMLVLAGALAAGDRVCALTYVGASLLANVGGDALWFAAGRRWERRVMRVLCRIVDSPQSCADRSESWIARWGGHSLIAAKFVPGVSLVAAPMAGALGMPWVDFLAFALLSGAIWTAAYMGAGVLFHAQVHGLLQGLAQGGWLAACALPLGAAALLGWAARARVRAVLGRWTLGRRRAGFRGLAGPTRPAARTTADRRADPPEAARA